MRSVHHPLFVNCNHLNAELRLQAAGKGDGDVIFRPSSKGEDTIAITWAYQAGQYIHFELEERGKAKGSAGLGKELVYRQPPVYEQSFSDLDEIYARFIEPMNDFIRLLIISKYFVHGDRDEVYTNLYEQAAKDGNRPPYCLSFASKEHGERRAGFYTFQLRWIKNINPTIDPNTGLAKDVVKSHSIYVTPDGYICSAIGTDLTFTRISDLVKVRAPCPVF